MEQCGSFLISSGSLVSLLCLLATVGTCQKRGGRTWPSSWWLGGRHTSGEPLPALGLRAGTHWIFVPRQPYHPPVQLPPTLSLSQKII